MYYALEGASTVADDSGGEPAVHVEVDLRHAVVVLAVDHHVVQALHASTTPELCLSLSLALGTGTGTETEC